MSEEKIPTRPITVFYSYSHKDEIFKEELETHLSILKRQGFINAWCDRKILPGKNWAQEIDKKIEDSDLILLLISPDFIASDYCYGIELKRAIDKHESNSCKVVPIIVRPIDWQGELISRLQALPKDATPVTTWPNRDEAWIDVAKGIRDVVLEINEIKNRANKSHGLLSIRDHLKENISNIEKLYVNQPSCGGISSGFSQFDNITDGLHSADFIVIAARPMMGKTDFLVNLISNISIDLDIPVAFFSMKLQAEQITKKLVCLKSNINSRRYSKGWFVDSDWPKLFNAADTIAKSKIFIDDSPTISIEELSRKAKQLNREEGLGLIVIDSLHHISNAYDPSDVNQISNLTRSLKSLAKELKVPIVASAQVEQQVETRLDKRPNLKDLGNWGGLVEDADVLAFLFSEMVSNEFAEKQFFSELIIGKNRNGPTGKLEYRYIPDFNSFREMTESAD